MAREKPPNRNRFETMYAILKLCSTGLGKTHIMYRASLSHSQLERYLSLLIEKNLLTVKQGYYTTTPRGYLFIKSFEELTDLINPEEEPRIYRR